MSDSGASTPDSESSASTAATPVRMPAPATNAHPPGVGDLAPDFTLRRTFEDSVSLRSWNAHGAIVLLFYVFDFGRV